MSRLKKWGIRHGPLENEAYRVSRLKRGVDFEVQTASYSLVHFMSPPIIIHLCLVHLCISGAEPRAW